MTTRARSPTILTKLEDAADLRPTEVPLGAEGGRAAPAARVYWAAAALLVVHVALAWAFRSPAISAGHDDALYLNLGEALRQFRYLDLHYPHQPVHSLYPPAFPALLAIAGALFGDHLDVYLSVGILWSAAGLALAFDAARRLWGPGVGLAVLAAGAVNPHLVELAGGLRSEPIMTGFMLLALWAVARPDPSRALLTLAGAAAIAAALSRTIGAAVPLALALHWLLERRHRALVLLALAGAATVGTWLVWTAVAPEQYVGRNYIADFTQVGAAGERGFVAVVLERLNHLVVIPAQRLPTVLSVPTVPGTPIDNLLGVAVILVCAGLGTPALWRRWRPAVLVVACYLAVMTFWPWKLARFFVPLQPLVWTLVLLGALALGRRWLGRWAWAPALACLGLILAGSLRAHAAEARRLAGCDRAAPYASACYPAHVRDFFAAARFAREAIPREALVLNAKDATWQRAAGHRVVPSLAALARPSEDFIPFLRRSGVEYVALARVKSNEGALARRLADSCRHLELLAAYPPNAYVFRVTQPGAGSDGAACGALTTYLAHPFDFE